jgi:hypothetical protein
MRTSNATTAATNLDNMSASQRLDFPEGPYPVVCTVEHVGIDPLSH